MSITEIAKTLEELAYSPAEHVTIEIDAGTFTVTIPEAIEIFDELAPGEAFEIIRE